VRADVFVEEVIAKCDALRRAGLWPAEPTLRTRAWLENFDAEDRHLAAFLLDKFTYYNRDLTDALLEASYQSIGDGLQKGPLAPDRNNLIKSLHTAAFTPVKGEEPNPTDSGYLLCRKARQILGVPQALILETDKAMNHAESGSTVVFLDDFIGSGDQFLKTWGNLDDKGRSFKSLQSKSSFTAIYITLITTDFGLENVRLGAPTVAVCMTHTIESKSNIFGIMNDNPKMKNLIEILLAKYATRLTPEEDYMLRNPSYIKYGYKNRGLMFGFEHSTPDATLPIFWSPGSNNWETLIERT
jgi:hypothetical protein